MKTSIKGINLIKEFEGCRLTAYKCPAGVWTIGYGHTGKVGGKAICSGMRITAKQAENFLKKDLERFEKHVMTFNRKYKWNQNQFDALVSFAYNVGSINQLTANGTRTITQISAKLSAYNKAAGKELAGLTRRRKAEKELFDKPVNKTGTRAESTSTTKTSTPKTAKKTLKKGAKVKIKSGAVDANMKVKYASFVYKNTYQVHSVTGDYVVFGDGKTATGKTRKGNVILI